MNSDLERAPAGGLRDQYAQNAQEGAGPSGEQPGVWPPRSGPSPAPGNERPGMAAGGAGFAPENPPAAWPGSPGFAQPPPPRPRQPFTVTGADSWFALVCFALGYLFIRWAAPLPVGWSVPAFALVFAAAVLAYARAKGLRPAAASWFWLIVLLLIAASFALYTSYHSYFYQVLLLYSAAFYWCGSLFGGLLEKKTGNYLMLDAVNLVFIVPFRNFGLFFKSVRGFAARKEKRTDKKTRKTALYIALGLLVSVPVLAVVLPLLLEADAGVFSSLLQGISNGFNRFFGGGFWRETGRFIWGFPVALYLCGLVAGLAHKRYTANINLKETRKTMAFLRFAPQATVLTAMAVVCALYVLFAAAQGPYFFSAFAGQRPAGYEVYSEYARDGFFELCRIAAINLALLALAWALAQKSRQNSRSLRLLSLLLASLTLLLICTAFSKMALYIGAYGLTFKRVIVCLFLLFLALMCAGVAALQFKTFALLRLAAVAGGALLCLFCLSMPDGWIARYNAARYLNGSLPAYDRYNYAEQTLMGGYGAVQAALEVCRQTDDTELKADIYRTVEAAQRGAIVMPQMTDRKGNTLTALQLRGLDMPALYRELEIARAEETLAGQEPSGHPGERRPQN